MALQQTSFKTDWPVNVKRRGWVGADIDKERQSFDLGPEQSAALRELVSKHMAAGTPYRAVSREQFSHSALDSFLARMVEELKWGKGVVFLRGVSIDSYTLDELRMLYWGIGTHFGMALCQKKFTGEYMLDITPKREIMQGYSGRQEFEFHTDYSEIGTFLCLQPAKSGGINIYASSLMLWDIFEREFPEYLPVLTRGFRTWRLNEHSPGDDAITPFHVPIFGEQDRLRSVYNIWTAVDGVGEFLKQPPSDLEKAAVATIYEVLKRKELHFRAPLDRGEAVFFNNYEVLHARTAITLDPAKPRHLLRLWLQSIPARALPENMKFHNNRSGLLGYDPFPNGTHEDYEKYHGIDPANLFIRAYYADLYKGQGEQARIKDDVLSPVA